MFSGLSLIFVFLAMLLPIWFGWKIWAEARERDWGWIRKDTRGMYIDCEKSIISACAIAASLVSLVVSARGSNQPVELIHTVKWAVVFLITGLVFSTVTIFAISRSYDRAVSRWVADPARKPGDPMEQGRLSPTELRLILVTAVIGMIGFLEGFLFVARITFVI